MGGWIDVWTDGLMCGWMNGWMEYLLKLNLVALSDTSAILLRRLQTLIM